MWVKIPSQTHRPRFLKLDDMSQMFVAVAHVTVDEHTGATEEEAGIWFNAPADELCLLTFPCLQEAEASLCNLFSAWSANRQSLYLIPQGTNWVIEKIGAIMESKGGSK